MRDASQTKKALAALALAFGLVLLGSSLFFPPLFMAHYKPMQTKAVAAQQLLRVELNTATAEALCSLPGLGEKKAQLIVQNRPFARLDELANIKGITQKDIEAWREYLYIEP